MVRALRGAVQVSSDTKEAIDAAVVELLSALFERNNLAHENLISVLFTATPDLVSEFPATSARALGLGDIPLLCAQELNITGAMPRVIRVMIHADFEGEATHVYLGGAEALRTDLAQ